MLVNQVQVPTGADPAWDWDR